MSDSRVNSEDRKIGKPMPLEKALALGKKILQWLAPFCERVELAGSIRRMRPVCNDIDVVAISRVHESRDLLGAVESACPAVWKALDDYVKVNPKAEWISEGPSNFSVLLQSGAQLDVWNASHSTFASVLLCRTGSIEHNVWLCQRAKAMGKHWNPSKGITFAAQPGMVALLPAKDEADIYAGLGLEWIAPNRREAKFLAQAIADHK